mmetsp:Transcript_76427/g.221951  ORF Transcript_76427/g.221951 Transcript_76427/m.221951 type:complete len:266 (-) Transcript_76427:715-1512(-)
MEPDAQAQMPRSLLRPDARGADAIRRAACASWCDPGAALQSANVGRCDALPSADALPASVAAVTAAAACCNVLAASRIQKICGKQPSLLEGIALCRSQRLKSCKVVPSKGVRAIMWRNNNASRTLLNWPAQQMSTDKRWPSALAKTVSTGTPVPRPRKTKVAPWRACGNAPSDAGNSNALARQSSARTSSSPPPSGASTTSRSEPSVSMPHAKLPTGNTCVPGESSRAAKRRRASKSSMRPARPPSGLHCRPPREFSGGICTVGW